MKFAKNLPKVYWWVKYSIGGQHGILPKPYSSQIEANNKAIDILRGAGSYEVYPLTTKIWRVAAKKLQSTLSENKNSFAFSSRPINNIQTPINLNKNLS